MGKIDYSLTYWFAFWILLFDAALIIILAHGVAFVAWPRLNPPTDLIDYNGPGFIAKRKGRGLGFGLGKILSGAGTSSLGKMGRKHTSAPSREIELGMLEKKRVE